MLTSGRDGSCCRGSWATLVGAGLVALLCLGLAFAGDRLFGADNDWPLILILSIGGAYAVTCGCACRGSRRRQLKSPSIDDGDDALRDWPSSS